MSQTDAHIPGKSYALLVDDKSYLADYKGRVIKLEYDIQGSESTTCVQIAPSESGGYEFSDFVTNEPAGAEAVRIAATTNDGITYNFELDGVPYVLVGYQEGNSWITPNNIMPY